MKQTIKLTESDLHRIVKESVMKILNENPAAAAAIGRVAAGTGARAAAGGAARTAAGAGARTAGAEAGGATAGNAAKGFDASKFLSDPNFIQSAANYGGQMQDASNKMKNDTADYVKSMVNNKDGFKGYVNNTIDYAKNMGNNISNSAKSGLNFAKDNPEFVSGLMKN